MSNLSHFSAVGNNNMYSMASGDDEFYLMYDYQSVSYLATYSESANNFVFEVQVENGRVGDMICNVDGELWVAGNDPYGSSYVSRSYDVYKVYPDTGKTIAGINNFPSNVYLSGGNMTCYGDKVVISDSTYTYYREAMNDPYILDLSASTPT